MRKIKKKKSKHIWGYWWKVKIDNHWERLCVDCGQIQISKKKPIGGRFAF